MLLTMNSCDFSISDSNAARGDDKMRSNSIDSSSGGGKNETNGVKINKRLKQRKQIGSSSKGRRRRRKIMIGDLSCMKAAFIEAPRVANADIKYIR
jgi:hypothetical protein